GMYLVHYVFVVWLQYALLGVGLVAVAKGAIVFGGTLLLSCVAVAASRRIPRASQIIGADRAEGTAASRTLNAVVLTQLSDERSCDSSNGFVNGMDNAAPAQKRVRICERAGTAPDAVRMENSSSNGPTQLRERSRCLPLSQFPSERSSHMSQSTDAHAEAA